MIKVLSETVLSPEEVSSQYNIDLIQDNNTFNSICEIWDFFIKRTQTHNPFMTHAWITAHLKFFKPEELVIIIIRDKDQVVATAPFKITKQPFGFLKRKLRTLTLIGNYPAISDYPQICIDPNAELKPITKAIADVIISKRKAWDIISLNDCPNIHLLQDLIEQLESAGVQCRMELAQKMPRIKKLPKNMEALQQRMNKRLRKTLNNITNRLMKDYPKEKISLIYKTDDKKIKQILQPFIELNIKHWDDRKKNSVFKQYPIFEDFLIHLFKEQSHKYNTSPLQLSILMLGSQPMSYQLGLWQEGHYTAYLCNYLPNFKYYKPGLLHFQKLIENTVQYGGQSFEFGRGEDDYKFLWSDDTISLWRLTGCQRWADRAELSLWTSAKRKISLIKTALILKFLNRDNNMKD